MGGRLVRTTAEHPFFVVGRGWVPAAGIDPGEAILGHDGHATPVDEVRFTEQYAPVYNLRVAEDHTYFVGGEGWGFSLWAHNEYKVEPRNGVLGYLDPDGNWHKFTDDLTAEQARTLVAEWNRIASDGLIIGPRTRGDAVKNGLSVRRSQNIGIHRPPRHHVFPQTHRKFFMDRGFPDIDTYTLPLDQATHDAVHLWMGSGRWNDVIIQRILEREAELGRLLSRREIMQVGAQMRREAGLQYIKVMPYQD